MAGGAEPEVEPDGKQGAQAGIMLVVMRPARPELKHRPEKWIAVFEKADANTEG